MCKKQATNISLLYSELIFLPFVYFYDNKHCMVLRSLLYIIAVILVIGWLLGFFVWHAGHLIHILLVFGVISLLIGLFRKDTSSDD